MLMKGNRLLLRKKRSLQKKISHNFLNLDPKLPKINHTIMLPGRLFRLIKNRRRRSISSSLRN